jgi:hypothetical protein
MIADGRYGMGVVYAKTGKLRHAEHHYRRAADINPSNAVLLSSIGSVSRIPTFPTLVFSQTENERKRLIDRSWNNWTKRTTEIPKAKH